MADNFQEDRNKKIRQIYESAYKIDVVVEDGGMVPVKAHMSDAGFDVYATRDICINFGEIIKEPLNIRIALPKGTYAQITTKSGLGSKGMLVYAGIIDAGYRGIVHVIATNLNKDKPIIINKGAKLAQMIIHPFNDQYYMNHVDSLDLNTDRGEGGFGSTDQK